MPYIDIMPTAIYKDKFGHKLTTHQQVVLDHMVMHPNELSNEMFLFDRPEFKSMKDAVLFHVKKYERDICGFKNPVSFRLTESWYRETVPGNDHGLHNHPNSMLSGCIYLHVPKQPEGHLDRMSADGWSGKGHEGINLYHPEQRGVFKDYGFLYDYIETKYNAVRTYVPVESGDIILFPSHINHFVSCNDSQTESRKIIAFNTFITGRLSGENSYPNVLNI
tara:strand:+ start:315 stop:977 length:663 start_codon:yes stop_codon:yes gene_type:complete